MQHLLQSVQVSCTAAAQLGRVDSNAQRNLNAYSLGAIKAKMNFQSASGKYTCSGEAGWGPEDLRSELGALPGPPAATMAATWARLRAVWAAPASRNAVIRSEGAQSTHPNSCSGASRIRKYHTIDALP